ncbi:MAG: uroporphyrinogen-III synthase [Bacteroidales bacterium]|nr:uroporphyrinogen-III synthase [Bacteroidales bacterium]
MNILVSQPQPTDIEKSPYGELTRKYNVNIDFFKFIKIESVPAREFRRSKINLLNFSAVIFTSRNAVDHYFRMATEMRSEIPQTMKYFCMSESTAFYLQKYVQYRKRKIFHGRQSFEDLIDVIRKHKEEKYLLPCSDIHKASISQLLDDNDVNFTKGVFYKTLASDLSHLDIKKYDMLVFFSPSGIASLFKNFPGFVQNDTVIGAFGPTTSNAVRESGLTLTIEAPTKTAPSMTMAIEEYLQKNNKKSR